MQVLRADAQTTNVQSDFQRVPARASDNAPNRTTPADVSHCLDFAERLLALAELSSAHDADILCSRMNSLGVPFLVPVLFVLACTAFLALAPVSASPTGTLALGADGAARAGTGA